jgi:alginate O-acetyltransferase complex protein AlgI
LFVKMVIADNISVYVDQIYSNPSIYSSVSILTGLLFYSFQIYCDFYGYSTIALGCAKVMGFNLMDNFKNPYISKNITEFWQRWHISLSTWFRDYVYFSLGGNRVKVHRWVLNILIVFAISGLWHGANWTFVLWGLANGFVYIIENQCNRIFKFKEFKNKVAVIVSNTFKIIKTFTIVSFIWILFRATDINHVKLICKSIIKNFGITDSFSIDPKVWLFFGLFIIIDILLLKNRFDYWCNKRNSLTRWSFYTIMIFLIVVFSSVNNFPFIYFQF